MANGGDDKKAGQQKAEGAHREEIQARILIVQVSLFNLP